MNTRQKCLYLVAKLYELAAEFTATELQEIFDEQMRQAKSPAIQSAIRSLMHLHRETETADKPVPDSSPVAGPEPSAYSNPSTGRTPFRQSSSLAALFEDKDEFPTVGAIVNVTQIEARKKEARERYLARLARLVETMSAQDRSTFFNELTERLHNRPNNFISKWSKLIREM